MYVRNKMAQIFSAKKHTNPILFRVERSSDDQVVESVRVQVDSAHRVPEPLPEMTAVQGEAVVGEVDFRGAQKGRRRL